MTTTKTTKILTPAAAIAAAEQSLPAEVDRLIGAINQLLTSHYTASGLVLIEGGANAAGPHLLPNNAAGRAVRQALIGAGWELDERVAGVVYIRPARERG